MIISRDAHRSAHAVRPRRPDLPKVVRALGPSLCGATNSLVIVIRDAGVAVLMALCAQYGFHTDELYFPDCARRLQASHVDPARAQPLLARMPVSLLRMSLAELRTAARRETWAGRRHRPGASNWLPSRSASHLA